MTTTADNALIAAEIKTIQHLLQGHGWKPANAVGELISPGAVVWFTATYTHGEYTVETSYRPTGAGPAQGVTRVRITPALVQARPLIARELAQGLIDVAHRSATEAIEFIWPPESWQEYLR